MEEGRGNTYHTGQWNTWLVCLGRKLGNHTAVTIYCFGDSKNDQSLILCGRVHGSGLLCREWGPRAVRVMGHPSVPTRPVPRPPARWAGLDQWWWWNWPQPGHPQMTLQALSPARKAAPGLGQCQVSKQSDTVQHLVGNITTIRWIQGQASLWVRNRVWINREVVGHGKAATQLQCIADGANLESLCLKAAPREELWTWSRFGSFFSLVRAVLFSK